MPEVPPHFLDGTQLETGSAINTENEEENSAVTIKKYLCTSTRTSTASNKIA